MFRNPPDLVLIAKKIQPYGLEGAVKCIPTQECSEFLPYIKTLYFSKQNEPVKYVIHTAYYHGHQHWVIKIDGILTPELAKEKLNGGAFFLSRNDFAKVLQSVGNAEDEDTVENPNSAEEASQFLQFHVEFPPSHLVGYKVLSETQEDLGQVWDIEPQPNQNLLVVGKHKPGEILIPYIRQFIISENTSTKSVTVNFEPLQGLYEN